MIFPELKKYDHIAIDTETNGIDRHGSSMPVGVSVAVPGNSWYFAFGHPSGNNCTVEELKAWCHVTLRAPRISLVNPSYDIHMVSKIGVNLDEMGSTVRGVQYACALLDETRRHYDLKSMAWDYLKKDKLELDPKEIHKMPGNMVAPYAKKDAELTLELDNYFAPLLAEQGLLEVSQLENDLIYSTLYMERQGVHLDMDKLYQWYKQCEERCVELEARIPVNVNSGKQLEPFFQSLGIKNFWRTEKDAASFTEDALLQYRVEYIDNAKIVAAIDEVLKLRSLRSIRDKYLGKYIKGVDQYGLLRYNLHQCRSTDSGTVTGRYSSSNVNIQQVSAEEKQSDHTRDWIIRELFVPAKGTAWGSADASQIEFRLFAHYARANRLIEAYNTDPTTDYHSWVAEQTGLIRKIAKNINFMMVYGGGVNKYAREVKVSLAKANEFFDKYNKEFPEARVIMNTAIRIAKKKGYVTTLLGRRRRYQPGDRFYSALNAVLQGSAADIMKKKILAVYKNMKTLDFNLRFTVHDEINGDVEPGSDMKKVRELLNTQDFPLRVPILWDCKVGTNWRLNEKSMVASKVKIKPGGVPKQLKRKSR